MGEYRHIETGEIKSQGQWRSHYKHMSLPRTWTSETLEGLQLEPVLEAPKPTAGKYQTVARNGVEKDANGNWVTAWVVRDMFSDYTDEDGVTHTKAEQEATYEAKQAEAVAESVRKQRNDLLSETDWVVVFHTEKGTNIPLEWEVYRQALRDITNQEGFPHTVEWPVKP